MDLLRSLGSAAASSLLQKSGLNLPYYLGERVHFEGIWALHDGTKKDDSSAVSIFIFDASLPNKRTLLPVAKNALRKLRAIRHPDILKFTDVVETDNSIHIVTERVQPLTKVLSTWSSRPPNARDEWLIWGLHRIAVALAFINESCTSTHGNIRVDSVFISPSGEWKLGGFEVLSNPSDEAAVLYELGGALPDSNAVASPEVKKAGWSTLKSQPLAAADAYSFGTLIHSVFNPNHPPPPTTEPPHAPPLPSSRGAIPAAIFPSFKRLLHPNAKGRLTPKGFLDIGMAEGTGDGAGFFARNGLLKICLGLDGFALASDAEKNVLMRTLKESAASFPPEFASFKVLPSLVSSLEQGGASASSLLPLVLQLGVNLPPSDYTSLVSNPLVKLFEKPDRGVRMALLDHLSEYIDKVDNKTVTEKVWPHLQTGFSDTVPIIREATVRSISLLYTKLSDRIMNNDLLRQLAKSQTDPEPSIRTNTCILLGRIATSLSYTTKRKVLVPAFSRSLKDPFVHARVAGLMALMASIECFEADEMASKVIPCMSPCLLDKEKIVRDQAFKAVDQYVKRIEVLADQMPETALINSEGKPIEFSNATLPSQAGLVNSAAGAAGALAGWAISSWSKTLAPSEMQSTIGNVSVEQPPTTPLTVGPGLDGTNGFGRNGVTSPIPRTGGQTPLGQSLGTPGPSRAKGLQLGTHGSTQKSSVVDELVAEATTTHDFPGAWDDGTDLIDVAADAGDWGEFATGHLNPSVVEPNHDSEADGWGDMLETPPAATQTHIPRLSTTRPSPVAVKSASLNTKSENASKPRASPSRIPSQLAPTKAPSQVRSKSPTLSPSPTPVRTKSPTLKQTATLNEGWDASDSAWQDDSPSVASATPSPALSSMSKEEKAAEMARRRDERKQRIAQLKEQKKAGGAH